MYIVNCLSRFRQYLRRRPQRQRPEQSRRRPTLEALEDRLVPSTLQVNFNAFGQVVGQYTASAGVNNNLTLSEKVLIGHLLRIEAVITDTAEKINVTGSAAFLVTGSGTTQVTIRHLDFLSVDVGDGNDVVNVQSIDYGTDVRHSGPGVDTVNVGNAGSLQGLFGIRL